MPTNHQNKLIRATSMASEIWVLPFFGQGHVLPCMELCKHIATSTNSKTTLIISSNLSSTIPSSFCQYPLLDLAQLPSSPPTPPHPGSPPMHQSHMAQDLENLISTRRQNPDSRTHICAIVDVMMDWSLEIFNKFQVLTILFFTSSACSTAMEYAIWKANLKDLKPGETYLLPGLPQEMGLKQSDLEKPHGPPDGGREGLPPPGFGGPPGSGTSFLRPPSGREGPPPPEFGGPPGPGVDFPEPPCGMPPPPRFGGHPLWLKNAGSAIAYMINTCDDLERLFIEYLIDQLEKPVWGVGPLLPEQYWNSDGSLFHDREVRTSRQSNVTEDDVLTWLDSKPHGSVLYVSFGTEVGPGMEDYPHLADALESSDRPFIWVIKPGSGRPGPPHQPISGASETDMGYFPHGLDKRVGERGLIIHGWAPQLLILSHPSTGGFLSHCGWNSIVEAIGRGVSILAWPIRGDQVYNAKLVVKYLKIGYMVCDDLSGMIKKNDIIMGIERLMGDEDGRKRAAVLRAKFEHGFPISSLKSLEGFKKIINQQTV